MSFLVIGKSRKPRQSRACHRCGKRHAAGSHRRRNRVLRKALAPLGPRPGDLLGASQKEQTQPKGWWRRGLSAASEIVQPAAMKVVSPEPRVALAPASMLRRILERARRPTGMFLNRRAG